MTGHENPSPGEAANPQEDDTGLSTADRAKLAELLEVLDEIGDGGAMSPWLVRRAADSVEAVLDLDEQNRRSSGPPGRDLGELSDDEVGRLRLLNRKLAEAEIWIRQRRDQSLADYYRSWGEGNRVGKHQSSSSLEKVDLEVKVKCVLRKDHPDFDDADENIVAELNWASFDDIVDDPATHNWNEFQFRTGHKLSSEHHCWLFHDLYDHVLHYNWDAMLTIGSICFDVLLIQTRRESW